MRVKGPKGAMVYTPNMVRRFGMIAGGTGITPMLQIVRAILRGRSKGDRTEVDLIFANVDEKDILLRNDLRGLEDEDNGFRVHYVLNNPPEKWSGGVGFVTAEMIKVCRPLLSPMDGMMWCGQVREQGGLIVCTATPPSAGKGYQDPDLRPTAHGQRTEESHRIVGLRQGSAREQAGGYGLLFLIRRQVYGGTEWRRGCKSPHADLRAPWRATMAIDAYVFRAVCAVGIP